MSAQDDEAAEEAAFEARCWWKHGIDAGGVARQCFMRYVDVFDVTRLVECECCGCRYPNLFPEPPRDGEPNTQGIDCAGYVKAGRFVGCYGSDFDTDVLEVRGVDADMDPVCDRCVMRWIREGRVTYLYRAQDGKPSEHRALVHRVGRIMANWR